MRNMKDKKIVEIDYDFSETPDWIARIGSNFTDYIQFGIIYTHSTYLSTLRTYTMCGDSKQRLNNGQLDFI